MTFGRAPRRRQRAPTQRRAARLPRRGGRARASRAARARRAHLDGRARRRDDRREHVAGAARRAHAGAPRLRASAISCSSVARRRAADRSPRRRARCPSPSDVARAGDEQRRAGVQQHDVARRPRLAGQHVARDARRSPRRRRRRGRPASPSAGRRRPGARRTCAPSRPRALGHLGVAGRRELVEAVGAVHDPGALRAEHAERPRHQLGQLGPRHADDLATRAGRVGQRAEQVEGGAHAELAAQRPRRAASTGGRSARRRSEAGLGERSARRPPAAPRRRRRAPRTRRRCRSGSTPSGCRAWRPARRSAGDDDAPRRSRC